MVQIGKSLSVSGLLVFGTTTSLLAKIVYELQSEGRSGETKYFRKPWAMTAVMFLGMSFCLPLAFYQERKQKRREESEEPLLGEVLGEHKKHSAVKEILLLSLPTAFDLVATVLMNIGLLYVTASVYQMMRGAEMLFAAAFAILFLGRKLNFYHLMGIICCVVGIGLVGTSSILSGEGSQTQVVSTEQMVTGMALIILSQAVQAAQLTFEDFFMADLNIPGVKIVGFEGLFGAIGTLCIMMPIAYYLPGTEGEGFHEDIIDTFVMIGHSRVLQLVLGIDMAALLMYNVSGMAVTGHLGAVFRTVLETMRTLFVWLVDLVLFYAAIGGGALGESWSVYSWIQAAGFVVLVAGTLVYRHGDFEASRQLLVEALALRNSEQPPEALEAAMGDGGITGPAPGTNGAPVTAPLAMPSAASAMAMPIGSAAGSFRASHTIVAGSYSRSLQAGSYLAKSPWAGARNPQHGGGRGSAHDDADSTAS